MLKMDIRDCEVEFASDLKQYGTQCDGHPFIGEQFYVVITNHKGRRWYHNQRFNGVKVMPGDEYSDGETYFIDTRLQARDECQRLVNRINARGWIGLDHWEEGRPAYGSDEYILGNWSAIEATLERMED